MLGQGGERDRYRWLRRSRRGQRRRAGAGRASPGYTSLPASQNLGLVTSHSMVPPKIIVCKFRKYKQNDAIENCKAYTLMKVHWYFDFCQQNNV